MSAKNPGAAATFLLAALTLAAPVRAAGGGAPQVSLSLGEESLFVEASSFGCATASSFDAPDIPMRAYRDDTGQVRVFLVNHENYAFIGSTLSAIARPKGDPCHHMLAPPANPSDPAGFHNLEWVMNPYTLNGRTVYAVVHNEFTGSKYPQFADRCKYDFIGSNCFYSSITLATSNDGGSTFTPAKPFVIAAPLEPFSPDVKHIGPYAQTNIVRNPNDGKFYMLMGFAREAVDGAVQSPGICVMRSDNLRDWRFWNGTAFDVEIGSPYSSRPAASRVCETVLEAGTVLRSVVYQPSSHLFIAVGTLRKQPSYWTSPDLLNWSRPAALGDERLSEAGYLSILDPGSHSRNFDTIDKAPNLYVTRPARQNGGLVRGKREVVMFSLKITPN